MAKTYGTAVTAVRNYLSESAEGFWDNDEIYSYLTYATMELWRHLILDDDNPYNRTKQHTVPGGSTAVNISDISESIYRIKSIVSQGNKIIPRYSVEGGSATGNTGYIQFSSEIDSSSHVVNVTYLGMPWNYSIQVEGSNSSVEIDVPEVYFPWIIQRAAISALEKAGHDTQDLKAESNKMLQSLSLDLMYGVEREGMA